MVIFVQDMRRVWQDYGNNMTEVFQKFHEFVIIP